MEVRIRLQKAGRGSKKRYNYRIVAMSKNQPRESDYLELIGHYDPAKKPAALHIDHAKLEKWIKQGAQMSDTVRSLAKQTKKSK
jgi:small subunit ribosomal protein S16